MRKVTVRGIRKIASFLVIGAITFGLSACGGGGGDGDGGSTIAVPETEPAPMMATDGLRDLAAAHGLTLGTALSPGGLGYWNGSPDESYLALLNRHFGLVMPEAGLFMSQFRPSRGSWDFDLGDLSVEYAETHGLAVRSAPLIWGHTLGQLGDFEGWTPTPQWVHESDLSRDGAIALMNEYIETVMTRYKGRIREWTVVNEPFGDHEVGGLMLNPNTWLELIGPDYIVLAFQQARRVDPDGLLILNDWGADYIGQYGWPRVDDFYHLIAQLLDDGAPIDGVGFQFHLHVGFDHPTVDDIVDNMRRYHALGLSTHVTELDVRIKRPLTDDKLATQADLYETVFAAALNGAYDDILLWGFTDRYSWIIDNDVLFPEHVVGTLMDENLNPYPSFDAIDELLRSGVTP